MNGPTDGPESGPPPGSTAPMAGLLAAALALSACGNCEERITSASLIGRRAERPASESEKKPRGPEGETDTAGAGRAAALDRAASRAIATDMVCSHRKLGKATR